MSKNVFKIQFKIGHKSALKQHLDTKILRRQTHITLKFPKSVFNAKIIHFCHILAYLPYSNFFVCSNIKETRLWRPRMQYQMFL